MSKQCPNCGNNMSNTATQCPFCEQEMPATTNLEVIGDKMQNAGKGISGFGCALALIPVMVICFFILKVSIGF